MLATVLEIPSSDRALAATQRRLERLYAASRDVRWLVALVAFSTHSPGPSSPVSLSQQTAPINEVALETALVRAQHLLAPHGRYSGADKARVVAAYTQLLNTALRAVTSARQQAAAAAVLTRVALVLASQWRLSSSTAALDLLAAAATGCTQHQATQAFAKWPLFASGALLLANGQQHNAQALRCFQDTVVLASSHSVDARDGAFHYWFSIALIRNARAQDASMQLQLALRSGFAPPATLNLAALTCVRQGDSDVYAAARTLQRALELETGASASLYNYAVLLGDLRQYVAQQQMLAYYQEAITLQHKDTEAATAVASAKKRERGGTFKRQAERSSETTVGATGATVSLPLVDDAQASDVLAPNPSRVTGAMVARQLAYAALENGPWLVLNGLVVLSTTF